MSEDVLLSDGQFCAGLLNLVLYEALLADLSISLIFLSKVLICQGAKLLLRC